MRKAQIERKTKETNISIKIELDGTGQSNISTGIGFFDHMLDQLAKHALIDMEINADGDLHIDDHHTVEDTGISLGAAIRKALESKVGIRRYGSFLLPMDDALIQTAIDISGRAHLQCNLSFNTPKIGFFDVELVKEFFNAFCLNSGITLHINLIAGSNSHHIAEATFKSVAQSLRQAIEKDIRREHEIPSTKGIL
ncbi:MAG: imidazoleglycerol-phosphate dehydratase HisB [Paracoccaceae bacterium]|nr:imidazoleglycerol-phosphate dehydratase HisB [Paracoccaceae bacterium]